MNKIHNCIDLLYDNGYEEKKETLKETYESLIDIYNLERNDPICGKCFGIMRLTRYSRWRNSQASKVLQLLYRRQLMIWQF